MELDDEALREVAAAVARAPPPQRRGISYILPASHSLSYAHHDPSAGVPAGYLPPLPPYQYQHHPSASYSSAATSRHSVGGASDGCMLLESAMSEYGGGHPSPPYPTPVESSVLSPSPSSLASRNRRCSPTNPSNPRTTAEPHLPLLVLGVAVLEAKKGPAFWLVLETCSKKVREMARAENFAGDGCSGGEGQVEMEVGVGVDGKGVIECRICQEEGEEDAMDSPCACTGTLKKHTDNENCKDV